MNGSKTVGIVNYGMCNLRSVAGAVERLGWKPLITNDHKILQQADKLIIPGVGAFGDAMQALTSNDLVDPLTELVIGKGRHVLGICLGFQLLAERSEEFGNHPGLGWVKGSIRKIPTKESLPLPHVGWNDLYQVRDCPLFKGIPSSALFYYVHSYYLDSANPDQVVGECEYVIRFPAVVAATPIFGAQFHPEKSQEWGIKLLDNFLGL